MVLKNISPGCGVGASLMLFFNNEKRTLVTVGCFSTYYTVIKHPQTDENFLQLYRTSIKEIDKISYI